MYQNIHNLQR